MGSIAEIGGAIITRSQSEAATISQNMANALTPGYRAQRSFTQELVPEQLDLSQSAPSGSATDFSTGKLVRTGNLRLNLLIGGIAPTPFDAEFDLTRRRG